MAPELSAFEADSALSTGLEDKKMPEFIILAPGDQSEHNTSMFQIFSRFYHFLKTESFSLATRYFLSK